MSDLSPETEELLARGREGAPMSRAQRDEIKGAVLAKLAAGAVVTTSTSAAAWTVTTKVIGVAAIAAVVSGGSIGVAKYRHAQAAKNGTTTSALAKSAAPISPAMSPSAIADAPANAPVDVTPAPIRDPASTTSAAPIAAATKASAIPIASTTTRANSLKSAAIVNEPTNSESEDLPVNDSPISPTVTPQVAATPHPSSLEEETTLLRAAHDAIAAGDPARALRLLDEHAARFPHSALEPERSAERVFAYCAEGNTAYAHAAAGSFLAAHPTGPLAARVRSSCGARYEK